MPLYYYVFDGLGSVVALLNTAGNVVARYTYALRPHRQHRRPRHQPQRHHPRHQQPSYGYTDRTTSLIKYGQRYYDPALGRWTQQDSIEGPGDPTQGKRYAYAAANPIDFVDVQGTDISCSAYSWECL